MATERSISIDKVIEPRYLFVEGSLQTRVVVDPQNRPGGDLFPVRMEVYTGWVALGDVFQAPLGNLEIRTFLPVSPGRIRVYQRES